MEVTRKERLIRILGLMQRTGARFTLDELAEMTGIPHYPSRQCSRGFVMRDFECAP